MQRAPPEPAAEPSEPLQAEQPHRIQSCPPHARLCLLAARRRRWQRLWFCVRSRKDRLALHQASGCSSFSIFGVLYGRVDSIVPLKLLSTNFENLLLLGLIRNQILEGKKLRKEYSLFLDIAGEITLIIFL